ncbi:sensor histidine kinase [Duganella qianjiadongensis]|uniref:histidine kinase n=1 Tax=Duganella qianjiadongensis TaxID=2692176 RepID=A0ABW9VJM7_9BURK|nr:sensor histidine kinase [Duganella qianjiadongensis]MYM39256.1 sensor histidine kinase [Duganella qianjiadongensis]
MSSIRLRLLKWLIGPILLMNLAGGALAYLLAWTPAQLAFDQSLAEAAASLGARLSDDGGALRLELPALAEAVLRSDDSDSLYFAVFDGAGRQIAGDRDLPLPPQAASARTRQLSDAVRQQQPVRLLMQPWALPARAGNAAASHAYIVVAKTVRKRQQIQQATLRALLLLEGLFALASIGLIWFSVSNGLLPLQRLRADLNRRDSDQLAALAVADLPQELKPVVHALNGLLEKVGEGAQARQQFLANVAHQLRTPLAGLKTQLEWLGARQSEADAAQSVQLMLATTERMIRQTNQLLALARAEPEHFEKTRLEPVALDSLIEPAIQLFVERASRKQIDLGFELQPLTVRGDHFLLRDLIDNLIDNAIRYTPAGGSVTVSCMPQAGGAGGMLVVEDSGPGIPSERREQVFRRFVRLDDRSSGSGLGLAIVRDIAIVHGAECRIDDASTGQGARFSIIFP